MNGALLVAFSFVLMAFAGISFGNVRYSAKTLLKKVTFVVAGTIFTILALLAALCGIYIADNEEKTFEYNSSEYTRTIRPISYDKEIPDTTFILTKVHEKEN